VIALVDYRAGNLTSVKKALAAVGADVVVPAHPADLRAARGIIVPGVGHFGATRALDAAWTAAIRQRVDAAVPLLGICLGLQWLYDNSDEAVELPGLGVLIGRVIRLPSSTAVKVPHVGWNSLCVTRRTQLIDGVPNGAQVYFTHSYVAPVTADTIATTEHGIPFASVVERGNVAGVQFHPEKSGDVGLRILRNWIGTIDGSG
jgi:glutamine amidotransferase